MSWFPTVKSPSLMVPKMKAWKTMKMSRMMSTSSMLTIWGSSCCQFHVKSADRSCYTMLWWTAIVRDLYIHPKQLGSIPLLSPLEPCGFSFPSPRSTPRPSTLSPRSQHCRTSPLFFTGNKLRPPGIGIGIESSGHCHVALLRALLTHRNLEARLTVAQKFRMPTIHKEKCTLWSTVRHLLWYWLCKR